MFFPVTSIALIDSSASLPRRGASPRPGLAENAPGSIQLPAQLIQDLSQIVRIFFDDSPSFL